MAKINASVPLTNPGRPSLKDRLRKSLEAPRAITKGVQGYNEGESDDFGLFVNTRLLFLMLPRSKFAEKSDATIARSDVSGPHQATQTSKSLVTRVIDGNRGLPLPRILSWAHALKIRGAEKNRQFLMMAITANALRDARRLVSKRNNDRVDLIRFLERELNKQATSFRWGDGCDEMPSSLRPLKRKFP